MRKIFLLILGFVACASQQHSVETGSKAVEIRVGEDFKLRVGESGQLGRSGALLVTFDSVSQDSRCPSGVQCVWAGNAAIHLHVLDLKTLAVLSVPDLKGAGEPVILNTTIEPKAADIKTDYQLILVNLAPGARKEGLKQSQYVATLRAEKLN